MQSPSPGDIRAARDAAGLTQEQAAALVHAARRAWQDWERGERQMPPAAWELFRLKTCGVALPAI